VSGSFMQELCDAKPAGRGQQMKNAPLDNVGGKLKKQYVLPDFHTIMSGYVKPDHEPADAKEQVLKRLPLFAELHAAW
jgi:hypothetical protein